MKNHWLNILEKKRLYKEIDEIGVEVWSEDGTFGDFISSLNDEQTDFIMEMAIRDFFADPNDEFAFGIELVTPKDTP